MHLPDELLRSGTRTGARKVPRVSRLPAVLLTGLLLVAGCSDDPEPGPTSTGTTSAPPASSPPAPAPSAEPTPWPEPTRPAAMERDDIEGAKAAAEYFLALYPYVYATGDLAAWQEMSHPECEFCQSTSDDAVDIQSGDGFAVVGAFATEDVVAHPPDEEFPHFRIEFTGVEAPSRLYSADGELQLSSPGGAGSYLFAVVREPDGWKIREALAESGKK